ncbi:hypothetical protein WA026_023214 [Henosepilachna vigintioctopunctata]
MPEISKTAKDDSKKLSQNKDEKSPEDVARLKARLRDTYSDEMSVASEHATEGTRRKKVRCITRAMAEDFSREQVLLSSLIETILYIIFAIACCIHVSSLKSSNMYYMTEALKQGLFSKEFEPDSDEANGESMEGIKFPEITTVTDMWLFMKKIFIETVYFDKYYNKYYTAENPKELSILYENLLLGVPRIRQVRVTNDSCEVHPYFQRLFKLCFAPYDEESEDTDPFGLNEGTAWTYSDEDATGNIDFVGKVATYNGGGYYLDLSLDGNEAKNQTSELVDNLWVTRHTRAVFIDFTVYNANLNIFAVCKIVFELPPTGGVLPSYKFNCVKLISSLDQWAHVTFVCETVFYIFIVIYLMQSVREFIYFRFKYWLRFWSYIDCIITGLAISTFIMINYKRNHVEGYINTIKENPASYGNLEDISYIQGLHDDISAITLFFVFIRFFKYLNFNKTMGQLNDTLKKCAVDVLGFSIMFFIIFFAYAELGFLIFGSQVKEFRTFGHSMFTLLRTILGDFDYEAIEDAHRVLAPIYFLSYIFLVFFVLLNMFLAIINDTYADVKTEIAITPSELQMTDYLKLHFFRIMNKCKCFKLKSMPVKRDEYNITADEIRSALGKCGFSYLEIEMFFARYNINPVAVVTEYDINKLVGDLERMTPGTVAGKPLSSESTKYTEELMM